MDLPGSTVGLAGDSLLRLSNHEPEEAKIKARLEEVFQSIFCPIGGCWCLHGCHYTKVASTTSWRHGRWNLRSRKSQVGMGGRSTRGHDEDKEVFGRGWAIMEGGQLDGMIFFHHGDESGLVAEWAEG